VIEPLDFSGQEEDILQSFPDLNPVLLREYLSKDRRPKTPWEVTLVKDGVAHVTSFQDPDKAFTFYFEACKQATLGQYVMISNPRGIHSDMIPRKMSYEEAVSIFSATLKMVLRAQGIEPPKEPLDPTWHLAIRKLDFSQITQPEFQTT
jgi:hypothetical protein